MTSPTIVTAQHDIGAWLRTLADAWEHADPDAAAALFTDDATYSTDPHSPPRRGRPAIRDYWAGEVAGQHGVRVRFGTPVVGAPVVEAGPPSGGPQEDGVRAVAEWWATLTDSAEGPTTLAGIVVLRFAADGRCAELREYWMASPWVIADPQPGWGQ